jgi:Tfp pilus assembly protein PilX
LPVLSNRSTADLSRDGGFALLTVLWTVALLALLTTRTAAAGRTEAQLAGNLRDAAAADVVADGAAHEAVYGSCFVRRAAMRVISPTRGGRSWRLHRRE